MSYKIMTAVFLLVAIFFYSAFTPAQEPEVSSPDEPPTTRPGFSTVERQWLEKNPVVTFTGDPNWLPYEAFNKDGEYIGIVSEHLKIIARLTGITFRMSPSKTWTESTEKAKQGLVDILSETDDSDLSSHLNFTSPYIANPIIIAMHSKENYVEKISDIKHRKIALIKDYGYAAKIRRKYPDIKFVTVKDIQHGLIAVSTGETDALLCTLALCSYTISRLGLSNVKITGKTEFDTKLALGVQKQLPELLAILDKAIAKITHEEQQTILDGWIKDKFVEKTDYTLAWQISVLALFLLLLFFLWNRQLSRQINMRIKTENELKAAQEVLRLSQQRMLLHREQTPLGVIEWNTDFEVVNWNPAAEKIFGYTKEEVSGHHITARILPESARKAVDKVWKDLLARRGGTRSTNENTTKNGSTILCDWYNTPLVDPDGKVIGVASLVDDITERKLAEKELDQYRHRLEAMVSERTAELEAANVELEAFSYSVSHDLRSPLRSIDGFSQLFLDDYSGHIDENGKSYLQKVRKSAQNMGQLIDDLLSMSRVTRSTLQREKTNLSDLANIAISKLQDQEPDRKISITITPGIYGWTDKNLFSILVDNLMENAWKYTGKTEYPKIEFGCSNQEGAIVYFVRDNGAGFSMSYAEKLFSPFQRLHKPSEFEGTGIGLATVERILRRQGGKIWAEAEIGNGATFYFTLGKTPQHLSETSVTEVSHTD